MLCDSNKMVAGEGQLNIIKYMTIQTRDETQTKNIWREQSVFCVGEPGNKLCYSWVKMRWASNSDYALWTLDEVPVMLTMTGTEPHIWRTIIKTKTFFQHKHSYELDGHLQEHPSQVWVSRKVFHDFIVMELHLFPLSPVTALKQKCFLCKKK